MWDDVARLAERHGLAEPDLGRLVAWGFGDFMFHTETDVISDVNKIYEYGFTERLNSLLIAIDTLKRKPILP